MKGPAVEIDKYNALRSAGAFLCTPARGVIEVEGADRASWLHNLTTNVVNTLLPGEGNYAFAINVQGRTLFDLNMLVLEDRIWLDIDQRWVAAALAHLDKYIIVEHVAVTDRSPEFARFQVLGAATAKLVDALGFGGNFVALSDLQHVGGEYDGVSIRLVKNNLGPVPRAEFIVPAAAVGGFHETLAARAVEASMVEIDPALLDVVRIEAGYPASVDDIDDQVIPPETRQVERGISYVKGCYLGQEVIERMRSRGSMARVLVGLRIAGERLPEHNAPVFAAGKEIGRVTSACHSVALDGILALGYVKTLLVQPGATLQVGLDETATAAAEIVDVPLPVWREG